MSAISCNIAYSEEISALQELVFWQEQLVVSWSGQCNVRVGDCMHAGHGLFPGAGKRGVQDPAEGPAIQRASQHEDCLHGGALALGWHVVCLSISLNNSATCAGDTLASRSPDEPLHQTEAQALR